MDLEICFQITHFDLGLDIKYTKHEVSKSSGYLYNRMGSSHYSMLGFLRYGNFFCAKMFFAKFCAYVVEQLLHNIFRMFRITHNKFCAYMQKLFAQKSKSRKIIRAIFSKIKIICAKSNILRKN